MPKDPYRYFRIEAHELLEGLCQGLLELEQEPDEEVVKRLLRQAHTFKGASRVVKRRDIADLAHEIEDLLSVHRSGGPVERETIDHALSRLDQIRRLLDALDDQPLDDSADQRKAPQPELNREPTAIRVAVEDIDAVLEAAFESSSAALGIRAEADRLSEVRSQARNLLDDLRSGRDLESSRLAASMESLVHAVTGARKSLVASADRLSSELAELRTAAAELRMVPAQVLVTELERTARDAARSLDRDARVHVSGVQTHIDTHVLSGVRTALIHIVRNSVAHGIEDPKTRERAGKPATGRIDVAIEPQGDWVSISCRDDGRGLDLASVRRVAVERGLVSRDAAASVDATALSRLLLQGGVSTSPEVTGISGRGVGLDAVRHVVATLEGKVRLESVAGRGTTVELLVPFSISTMRALSLHVDDMVVLVPFDSVRKTLRMPRSRILRDADGERLVDDGVPIPFLPLWRALKRPRRAASEMESVVVLEASGRLAALGVERVGVTRNVMVRAIPEHAAAAYVSGAVLDEEGVPQLVLAPPALVRAASAGVAFEDDAHVVAAPPILIIDDSLTTRMLERSILESAGYEVDLAVSGEDGLEKARHRRYGVFIVDVEMPGIDGFEFIARTRSDPELRGTPCILVTSRSDRRDKIRGKELGARAYIVKNEFDQGELLEAIRRLVE